jgi:transposase
VIDQIIKDDAKLPRKLRTTAMRILQILREKHGYTGGYTMVQEYVYQARHSESADTCSRRSLERERRKNALLPDINSTSSTAPAAFIPQPEAEQNQTALVLPISNYRLSRLPQPRREVGERAYEWMRSILQGAMPLDVLAKELSDVPLSELKTLLAAATKGELSIRNRSLAILSYMRGISPTSICPFLQISDGSLFRYLRNFRRGGTEQLFARKTRSDKKANQEANRVAVFSLLHSPPATHGINRTSWRMADLQRILSENGHPMCGDVIHAIIQEAGWKWKHARLVLTSNDPDYRAKVDAIKHILSELKPDEAFFSIDEYGPFAIKKKGGVKHVAPGEQYVVPQWQRSKGWTILTAALELSRNQVSHFYSRKKNTDEMIKMADCLRTQYHSCSAIYLSWDAASWHISKNLSVYLEKVNQQAEAEGFPIIKTAPLPACAQFLNVIESVFSGMARAIIHNSDYPSVEAAKEAIDRYFEQRNADFLEHPKRAGQKIWGQERVPSVFAEEHNCKDPIYQYPFS